MIARIFRPVHLHVPPVSLALCLIASGGCTVETEADKKTVEALSKLARAAVATDKWKGTQ